MVSQSTNWQPEQQEEHMMQYNEESKA